MQIKASWVKFARELVGIRTTRIYYQLKNLEYVKDLLYESTSRNFSAPALNFVIFMSQRPSANIAELRVRAKFTRILSDSVKC